MSGFDII